MNEEYGLRDDIKVICTVGASAKKAFFYALEAGKTSDSDEQRPVGRFPGIVADG